MDEMRPPGSARAFRAVVLAVLTLLIATLRPERASGAPSCREGISQANAQRLYDELVRSKPSDGCTLEGVETESSAARIVWKKDGRLQEPILVVPTSCATTPSSRGKVLSAIVPASVAADCPVAVEALGALVVSDAFGGLVPITEGSAAPATASSAVPVTESSVVPAAAEPPSREWKPLATRVGEGLVAAALASGAFFALRWRRRRRALRAADGSVPKPRLWQRNPSQAGWGAAFLIGPHLVLGTWLLVVPDRLAFTAAQVVTLAHVGLAVVTFPLVALWVGVHLLKMRSARARGAGSTSVKWLLTAALLLAIVTGVIVIWGGDIAQSAPLHAACGVAVGVPLALHFWLSMRRVAAGAVVGLLAVATLGSAAARRWLPQASAEATIPEFEYATRDESLYEPAANCGECHEQDYQDWKRSTHARTLELEAVRESMGRSPDLLEENLAHVGKLISDRERPISSALVFGACGSCHAPTSFYGGGKPSLLHPAGLTAEGTSCSFCHTLREVRHDRNMPSPALQAQALSSDDIFAIMSRVPFYVSAPETVRRYLFQGSSNPLARRIANYLIRWRPEVHSRDYHSPVLDDSRACLACHSLGIDSPDVPHMTYFGWEHSPFATGDQKTTVTCQDCHMVRHMTGDPVNESARMVPWGPVRPGARSHLFLGGNVKAGENLGDEGLARQQHDFNARAASVSVSRLQRVDDVLHVTVSVHSERIGHYFPALETQLRYGWVELRALDASGRSLASTPAPKDSQDYGCASPLIMASVDDPKPDNKRLVGPRASREFVGHITLPPGAVVDRVVAELHVSVDPSPIATATESVDGPRSPL
jgi:hypothetical protein